MTKQAFSVWHGMIDIPPPAKSSQDILRDVAARHSMSVADMLSPSRKTPHVHARWEAMHLLHITPKHGGRKRSSVEIGRLMGGLDHTTVLHSLRRYAEEAPAIQAACEAAE